MLRGHDVPRFGELNFAGTGGGGTSELASPSSASTFTNVHRASSILAASSRGGGNWVSTVYPARAPATGGVYTVPINAKETSGAVLSVSSCDLSFAAASHLPSLFGVNPKSAS